MSRPVLLLSSLAALALCSVSDRADGSEIIYREIFPNSGTSASAADELVLQGWFGGQHDDVVGMNDGGQLFDRTTPPSGSMNPTPSSMPMGLPGTDGRMTWTPDARAGVYLYTDEFQFPTDGLKSISFDSRSRPGEDPNQPQNDRMRVALRIGNSDDWYITDQFVYQTADNQWQTNTFDLTTATWELFDVFNLGPGRLPRSDGSMTGLSLPDGIVTAFGVYNTKNQQGTFRIDDFTIEGRLAAAPIPEPSSVFAFAACAIAAVGFEIRRRRRNSYRS